MARGCGPWSKEAYWKLSISGQKWQYLTQIVLAFDFSDKWHYKNNKRKRIGKHTINLTDHFKSKPGLKGLIWTIAISSLEQWQYPHRGDIKWVYTRWVYDVHLRAHYWWGNMLTSTPFSTPPDTVYGRHARRSMFQRCRMSGYRASCAVLISDTVLPLCFNIDIFMILINLTRLVLGPLLLLVQRPPGFGVLYPSQQYLSVRWVQQHRRVVLKVLLNVSSSELLLQLLQLLQLVLDCYLWYGPEAWGTPW